MTGAPLSPHPVFQAVIDAYAASGRPFFHQVTPAEARDMLRQSMMMAAPKPVGHEGLAAIIDETIEGPHGPIPVRRYLPEAEAVGTCLYLHAGGWVIGDLDFSDATCRRLAVGAQCQVVSVDYRLAPEHPYPQPLDDAYAALEWAAGRWAGPLLIAGESAGANLAAACAIRARQEKGPVLAGQLLAYPVTDHDFDTASYREVGHRNWLLSTADMRWFWDQYAGAEVDRTDPLVSPLRVSDAAGLPPAMIATAQLDPLREEGLAYAQRLLEAGVPVVSRCDEGMVHGYLGSAGAVPLAAEALAAVAAWMRARLVAAGPQGLDV